MNDVKSAEGGVRASGGVLFTIQRVREPEQEEQPDTPGAHSVPDQSGGGAGRTARSRSEPVNDSPEGVVPGKLKVGPKH